MLKKGSAVIRYLHSSQLSRKDFKLTDIGEGIVEVEVLKWHIKPGDLVKEFDTLVEVQSDKATVEITSRFAGKIKSLQVEEGKTAKVGQVLVVFEDSADSTTQPSIIIKEKPKLGASPTNVVIVNGSPSVRSDGKLLATPAVRHLLKERGIAIDEIVGTGRDGRVLKSDVLEFLQNKEEATTPEFSQVKTTITTKNETDKTLKNAQTTRSVQISGIRKEMAKTMTASLSIPHMGLMDDIRVDEVYKIVKQRKNLTMLAIIVKATSLALLDYPELNATVSSDVKELQVHSLHNIGIAMDTPRGLLVPVISDVKSRSILNISEELTRLKDLGSANKLGINELSGATFSLSNIGSIAGTYATPVIAPPMVAMGVLGRAKRVPIFENSTSMNVVEGRIMAVSWAADHRVIDGALLARFSNSFKKLIEDPLDMLLRLD